MKKLEVFDSYDEEVVTKIDSPTVKLRNKCMAQAGWDFYCTKGTTLNYSLRNRQLDGSITLKAYCR